MILWIQIILIIVLFLILGALYIDEKQKQRRRAPSGKLIQFWDGSERRVFTRLNCDIPIKYSLPHQTPHAKFANSKDVSIGGICVSVKEKLSLNDKLSLEIDFPGGGHPVIVTGQVAWVKEDTPKNNPMEVRRFRAGLEFKDISPRDRDRLLKFIKESSQVASGQD